MDNAKTENKYWNGKLQKCKWLEIKMLESKLQCK